MTDKPIDKTEAAGRQLDGACLLRLYISTIRPIRRLMEP